MCNKDLKLWFVVCIFCFAFISCTNTQNKGLKGLHDNDFENVVIACKNQTQKDKVLCRGLKWLFINSVDIQKDGFLELGEELNLFYKLYLKSNDIKEKEFFRNYILSRIDYLLEKHDLRIEFAGEITGYLYFAKIMKIMGVENPKYFDFITKDILVNQMTYPPNITYTILNTSIIEDLGYNPRIPLRNLVNKGVISQFSNNPDLTPIGKAYASPDHLMNFFYDITHEVFALSSFGDKNPKQYLLSPEIEFLKDVIIKGVSIYSEKKQVDILGELIICAKLLEYKDFEGYKEGIQFILDAQNEDGSFGVIERMAYLGRPNVHRHGVLVALWALLE